MNLSLLLLSLKMSLYPNRKIQLFGFLTLRNSLAPLMLVASDPTVLVVFCGIANNYVFAFLFTNKIKFYSYFVFVSSSTSTPSRDYYSRAAR